MTRCHCQNPFSVACRNCDRPKAQCFTHRRTRPEYSVHWTLQFADPEGRSDGLCQQIPREDDSYIFRATSCFFDCQPRRLLLQHTLCFFPVILSQLIIRLNFIKERSQWTFPLFFSNNRCPAFHIDRLFQPNTLFPDLHLLPPFCHVLYQSQHP